MPQLKSNGHIPYEKDFFNCLTIAGVDYFIPLPEKFFQGNFTQYKFQLGIHFQPHLQTLVLLFQRRFAYFYKKEIMQFETFQQSIKAATPPVNLTVYLLAMWYDGQGDWKKAHSLVDSLEDDTACWVHAYLHRKEGDTWNADYWYRKAGRKRPDIGLQQEWDHIVKALL